MRYSNPEPFEHSQISYTAELARLRASNADLLAALKELESHCYAGALELAENHPAIAQARAAIAKAQP